jgi:hypothetical protein
MQIELFPTPGSPISTILNAKDSKVYCIYINLIFLLSPVEKINNNTFLFIHYTTYLTIIS